MNSTKIESPHNNRNGAILVPTSPLGNTTNKAYEKALANGILTQVLLVISFIIIRLSNFHQVLIMHPWMTLLGFSCIHIYCNYLFYRKFVIPTCDKNTNEYILEDSEQRQQDEQPEVVEPSSVGKIYARLILIFFLFCNITVLIILYGAFQTVAGDSNASVLLMTYSALYCLCLVLLDISKVGSNRLS